MQKIVKGLLLLPAEQFRGLKVEATTACKEFDLTGMLESMAATSKEGAKYLPKKSC